jgi:hypothetical protein
VLEGKKKLSQIETSLDLLSILEWQWSSPLV